MREHKAISTFLGSQGKEWVHEKRLILDMAHDFGFRSILYFETTQDKQLDLRLLMFPEGPTIKFRIQNIHTTNELKNHPGHSEIRPLLSFQNVFEEQPHLRLIKIIFSKLFVSRGTKSYDTPFDHVVSFSLAENRIWMRVYQVTVPRPLRSKNMKKLALVEVGPRACLVVTKIFADNFERELVLENFKCFRTRS